MLVGGGIGVVSGAAGELTEQLLDDKPGVSLKEVAFSAATSAGVGFALGPAGVAFGAMAKHTRVGQLTSKFIKGLRKGPSRTKPKPKFQNKSQKRNYKKQKTKNKRKRRIERKEQASEMMKDREESLKLLDWSAGLIFMESADKRISAEVDDLRNPSMVPLLPLDERKSPDFVSPYPWAIPNDGPTISAP